MSLGWTPTLIIFASAFGMMLLSRYRANRPYEPGTAKHIPWNIIMIMSAAVGVFMLVHMFTLSGMDVGAGRRMP